LATRVGGYLSIPNGVRASEVKTVRVTLSVTPGARLHRKSSGFNRTYRLIS